MTKSTGLLLGCLGLLAGSIVAEWADAHAVASANSAIAELDQRTYAAEQRRHQAAHRVANATKDSQQVEASLAKLTHTPPGSPTPTRTAASVFAIEWAKRWEKQLQDPKVQNENLAIDRARLHGKFAPLYRELHLTPEQIAAFEQNEAAYQVKQSDLNAALLEQRISMLDPIAKKLVGLLVTEENVAQRSALGDSGYAAFQEFERTSQVRDVVSRVAGAATVMGDPLNAEQSEQLVRVIASADPQYAKGGSAGRDIDWERALSAVQPILSPTQFDVLQNLEPPGGGRFFSALNAAIQKGAEADRKANEGSTPPSQ